MSDYRKVAVAGLPDAASPARHVKEIDEAVGTDDAAVNLFVVDPGQRMPSGYHYHANQEELFYVIDGTIEFQTAEGVVTVEADEAFYVPPGRPQKGSNAGDVQARVLAIGAPKDEPGGVVQERCDTCERVVELTHEPIEVDGRSGYVLRCDDCGTEVDRFFAGPD
jgi:uncharacterized cupin superfamily protein